MKQRNSYITLSLRNKGSKKLILVSLSGNRKNETTVLKHFILCQSLNKGACAQRNNREVFLCFEDYDDSSTWKNCHRSTGPLEVFSRLPNSNYDHRSTRIAVTSGKPSLVLNLVLLFRLSYGCWWP